MKPWHDMMLPNEVLRALYDQEFYEPMPIQNLVVPEAIKNRSNIIGAAQTVLFCSILSILVLIKNKD
jgi:superfamily II DNA/RNA helicase